MKYLIAIFIVATMLAIPMPTQAQEAESCADFDVSTLEIGDSVVLSCDEDCSEGSIWGTGIYTSDSDICTAAAHSGFVTLEEGGTFMLHMVQGLNSYDGSELNGITSSDWDAWETSFTFTNAPIEFEASTAAQDLKDTFGEIFLGTCAPETEPGVVWGTDVYTDDSSVCSAAANAGVITLEEGGAFFLSLVDGQESYTGSEQNGVSTSDYGEWPASFVVTPALLEIEWSTSAIELAGPEGTTYHVSCPAEGTEGSVWGTGIYTDDSSVCTAAAHMGFITLEDGGQFFVQIGGATETNEGSEQNGITTSDWTDGWERNFVVGFWSADLSEMAAAE